MPANHEAARSEVPAAVLAWRARVQHFRSNPEDIDAALNRPMLLTFQPTRDSRPAAAPRR